MLDDTLEEVFGSLHPGTSDRSQRQIVAEKLWKAQEAFLMPHLQ